MSESAHNEQPDYDQTRADEQAVLSAILTTTPAYDYRGQVFERLDPEDFESWQHQLIYRTLRDMYGAGRGTDQMAATRELNQAGQLQQAGGLVYLSQLVQMSVSAAMAEDYAENVRAAAEHRRVMQILVNGPHRVRNLYGEEMHEQVSAHVAELEPFLNPDSSKGDVEFERWGDGAQDHLDRYESDKPSAVAITGFTDLDLALTIKPSQLIIGAGRPGMGKSAFALGVARSNALAGNPTLFCSMEMGREEIGDRVIAGQARVGLYHLTNGKEFVTETDWTRIAAHVPEMAEAPLYMDYRARQTPSRIRARIRYVTRLHGRPPLTIVDYLGLMQPEPTERINNQYERITYLSRELKLIAQETGAPIIALAQLNRGPESREDKKPGMSDLRDSGAIEQDANAIILLHRPDYYEKESPRSGEVDLIVAKNRNGHTFTTTAAAQLHYARFVDMAQT
ncbi:replicative DNA helicase [Streptomyces sp. LBUM 1486]|uniref:replicative DNA helicase n=1 Tax=Streptomyces scabiei TaxID=1930 RepID=UPI001B318E6C|nr:DnaB-like helicase C-terminal domain-containing protein [Streptomyces sp. LBUM 1486]MBP5915738.1 replicative DNA helicase [Streptomyces sp. LBUM 1486]